MGVVGRLGAPWLAGAALSACTTTATISRSDGYQVEGWIRGGSGDAIVVEPRVGRRQVIPRNDVTDIDHPGNVHIVVGGVLLGFGASVIASGVDDCVNRNDGGTGCFFMVTPAILGASMVVWGLATWLGSKDSAADTSQKLPSHEERIGPRLGLPPPEGMLPPPPAELPGVVPSASPPPAPSDAPVPAVPAPSSSVPEPPSTLPPEW